MRYTLLILLVLLGIDFGRSDVTQACDWLKRRTRVNHVRSKCCRPCPPAPAVCRPSQTVCTPPAGDQEPRRSDEADLASIADAINKSQSVSYTTISYARIFSKDGQQTWLVPGKRQEMLYRSPQYFRDTRYDEDGNVWMVQIVDASSMRTLTLDVKAKKAMPMDIPFNVYEGGGGPLDWIARMLEKQPPDFVERREINGTLVDIYRYGYEQPRPQIYDLWVDAKTKRLIGVSESGGDPLDLSQSVDPADVPKRSDWGKGSGQRVGMVKSDIALDAPLSAELFSFEPPDGFEVVDAPQRPNP